MINRIDKTIIMTLQETPYRTWGMIGALDALKFPMQNVDIRYGVLGKNYRYKSDLIRDIVQDGFPFFDTETYKDIKFPIGVVAGSWNVCRCLREIMDNDKTVLLMEDDWIPNVVYPEIEIWIGSLPPKCEVASLHVKGLQEQLEEAKIHSMFNEMWFKGIIDGFAGATIMTPIGAEKIMSIFQDGKQYTLELAITHLNYPFALQFMHQEFRHPEFMGPSMALPKNSREHYLDNITRWSEVRI